MKYSAFIIAQEIAYVSNATGEIVKPSSEEILLDAFLPERKFTFVELFKKVAEIKAKTLRDLNQMAWNKAEYLGIGYDFSVYIVPKK